MSSFFRRVNPIRTTFLLVCVLMLSGTGLAGPYGNLQERQGQMTDAQVLRELRALGAEDAEAMNYVGEGAESARAYINLRASLEDGKEVAPPKIGPSPGQERLASSWLNRALGNLRPPKFDRPDIKAPNATVGNWVTTLMWGVLAVLLGFAIYLVVRYVRLPGLRKRKSMIATDEPLRSADAWLEEANALIARGQYREAVRGLYVAGLMRFDEAGVARFDRHQTNWEHLRRIEASPKTPTETDVRDATGRFDRIWYGHLPATDADARDMRSWYDRLTRRLAEPKSAGGHA